MVKVLVDTFSFPNINRMNQYYTNEELVERAKLIKTYNFSVEYSFEYSHAQQRIIVEVWGVA